MRLESSSDDLEISVTDWGDVRRVVIEGKHVVPGGSYNCEHSELETKLSVETLAKLARKKGRYFRDEIERGESPRYMLRSLQLLLDEFGLELNDKKVLDFGCGSGASSLNFARLGAGDIVGVDADKKLIDIARSRMGDLGYHDHSFEVIPYIDGKRGLRFSSEEFDVVWAHAVLEHVWPEQRKSVLREIWRVLKAGGYFIIDATPNRLWPKEYHTSGIWFLNYLPLGLAGSIARRLSDRVPIDQSLETLLSRGFRGCTYWEIIGELPGSICLNTRYREKVLKCFMSTWRLETDSAAKRFGKNAIGFLMELVEPALKVFGWPKTALLPQLTLVIEKQQA
jgi:ubiquinone/menaquinone biosynthesis C-methylase UbiE